MDICIVINTCKEYYKNIESLIKEIDLYNHVFPKENILIVSGQEDENKIIDCGGIKVIHVTYSGLHLTGAIYVYENIHKFANINYWMILPDTITFGKNFFNIIFNIYNNRLKNKEIYSLPFINPNIRQTMDMGIIHTKHIVNISDYLKKIKITNFNKNDLIKLKKQLIHDENLILGLRSAAKEEATKFDFISSFTEPNYFITNYRTDLEETTIRINDKYVNQVYFKQLDLYKFQRNFDGLNSPLVMNL